MTDAAPLVQPSLIQPQIPLPLLITGIAGVAGYNALHYFRAKYPGQVVGMRQADNRRLRGEGIVPCNAEDAAGLARLFDTYEFRSVLDCAGNCALRACELDPELAWVGVKHSGRGQTLSRLGYEPLTRPKSFHLRTELP